MPWKEVLNWSLGILSIVLSSIFFWIQVRRSISARTERRARVNGELINLLITRLILEDYLPTTNELHQIREGIAVRSSVDPEALASDSSVLSLLYSSVVENNYITPERRREILKKIEHAFQAEPDQNDVHDSYGAPPLSVSLVLDVVNKVLDSSVPRAFVSSIGAALALGIAASATAEWFSGSKTGLGEWFSSAKDFAIPIAVATLIIGAIIAAYTYERTSQQRRSLERISRRKEESTPREFERRVLDSLARIIPAALPSAKLVLGSTTAPFDAIITSGRRKVALEIKFAPSQYHIPKAITERWLAQLRAASEAAGASRGLVIVPNDVAFNQSPEDVTYRIVPLRAAIIAVGALLAMEDEKAVLTVEENRAS